MKKKITLLLAILAVCSVAVAGIGSARAYFTTYVEAKGGRQIRLGDQTSIKENYSSWEKDLQIENNETSPQAVYVRARAIAGQDYKLVVAGEGWTKDGDYWYYGEAVPPGGATSILNVKIQDKETGEDPVAEPNESMDVVIVYETIPAYPDSYDEDGNLTYEPADWSVLAVDDDEGGQG